MRRPSDVLYRYHIALFGLVAACECFLPPKTPPMTIKPSLTRSFRSIPPPPRPPLILCRRAPLLLSSTNSPTTLDPTAAVAEEHFQGALGLYEGVARSDRMLGRGEAGEGTLTPPERDAALVSALSLLERTFELDEGRLAAREGGGRLAANVTCMRPADPAMRVGARLFDSELAGLELEEGRVCHGGTCCGACSRAQLLGVADLGECARMTTMVDDLMPPLAGKGGGEHTLHMKLSAASGHLPFHLLYVRLVERMRRQVAREWGIPLRSLSPRTTFVSRIEGGGADPSGDKGYSLLHVDECSVPAYHYSAVLYLSPSSAYVGGDFVFADEPGARGEGEGCEIRRVSPQQGQMVAFSSGWENPHYVDTTISGVRYAVPTFFTTSPPEAGSGGQRGPEHVWGQCGPEGRARAVYEGGLMPESLDAFQNFKEHWGEAFCG